MFSLVGKFYYWIEITFQVRGNSQGSTCLFPEEMGEIYSTAWYSQSATAPFLRSLFASS